MLSPTIKLSEPPFGVHIEPRKTYLSIGIPPIDIGIKKCFEGRDENAELGKSSVGGYQLEIAFDCDAKVRFIFNKIGVGSKVTEHCFYHSLLIGNRVPTSWQVFCPELVRQDISRKRFDKNAVVIPHKM